MVVYIQIKGNNLIKQKQELPFKIIRKKIRKELKEKGNNRMMSRLNGRRFIYYEDQNSK